MAQPIKGKGKKMSHGNDGNDDDGDGDTYHKDYSRPNRPKRSWVLAVGTVKVTAGDCFERDGR